MNEELITKFEKAVVDTVNVHYMLKCLYAVMLERNDADLLNIAQGVAELGAKVLDEVSYVLWDVVDAVKTEKDEFPHVKELMKLIIEESKQCGE